MDVVTKCTGAFTLGLCACAVLAGCAATPKPKPTPTMFATSGGMSAASIASHVAACQDVRAIPLMMKDDPGLESVAQCTIQGHRVVFDAFDRAHANDEQLSMPSTVAPFSYDFGNGWVALMADDQGIFLGATDSQDMLSWEFANPNGDHYQPDVAGEHEVDQSVLAVLVGQTAQSTR